MIIGMVDADDVILSVHVSYDMSGVLCCKRKKVFESKQLCSEEMSKTIVQLHIKTGADAVSTFYSYGKMFVMQNVV